MTTATPLRSSKSVRSSKSEKTNRTSSEEGEIDFHEYIKDVLKRFSCEIVVVVLKHEEREAIFKPQRIRDHGDTGDAKTKHTDKTDKQVYIDPVATELVPSDDTFTLKEHPELQNPLGYNTLVISINNDNYNRLTEISICDFRVQCLPRKLIQLIGLVLPYYSQLYKLTIKNCFIDFYTLYELGKVISYTTITDVCLDDCPLPAGNYDAILNGRTCVRNLSLCRCRINDDVCERLSSRLVYTELAEESLVALNLTSNHITDVGAKYLADALRSNKHLRYLNLADNLLGDVGARHIFDVMVEFPLTNEEIFDKRHRYMLYLKKKQTIILEFLLKFSAQSSQSTCIDLSTAINHGSTIKKKESVYKRRASSAKINRSIKKEKEKFKSQGSDENLPLKAEMMTREILGEFVDPFSKENIRIDNGYAFSLGNRVLSYLNLAYNELTYISVKKLLSVIEYQQEFYNSPNSGLFKVVLDGNPIPNCTELAAIHTILNLHNAIVAKQITDKYSLRKSLIDKKTISKK
ncbi:unnamed protein product [Chrysodeixis includens]|uniref:Leucine-rich repeat-containing protein 71-like n=1 Tax=Chrysodeixis includens TaxID=689277 RepID=A0A9P0FZG4_CHRIL|nr:unnamed protein product [Chrysodeixis includens]